MTQTKKSSLYNHGSAANSSLFLFRLTLTQETILDEDGPVHEAKVLQVC